MYLTQNSEMRRDGVWNFTLPAWVIELQDGSHFNVCPNAGACAKVCYARNGTYLFPQVRAKHQSNLALVKDDPDWVDRMCEELAHKRFRPKGRPRKVPGLDSQQHLTEWVRWWLLWGGQAVRIHDSGDFFDRDYLEGWLEVARRNHDILFYFYTKEVMMLRDALTDGTRPWPRNVLHIYSMGGKQDHLIDKGTERHADVFPDDAAIEAAGYMSQDASDLLAVLLPTTRIGIPLNNIPAFRKRLDGRTFAEAQQDRRRR